MALKEYPLLKACLAEFVAMTLFVWCGTGSALATNSWGSVTSGGDLLTIATAFGFTISLLAFSIGHISGGHINPAVSFGMLLLRIIDFTTFAAYCVAQFSGAILGSLLVWGSVSSLTSDCDSYDDPMSIPVCASTAVKADGSYGPPFGLGVNSLSPRNKEANAFLIETIGTYLLVFVVIMSVLHKKSLTGNAAPIAIGWAVMMAHIVMIPYTGCGINPARSLGPMVVNSMGGVNMWSRGWWVYYVAPFLGSALAVITYKALFEDDGEVRIIVKRGDTTDELTGSGSLDIESLEEVRSNK